MVDNTESGITAMAGTGQRLIYRTHRKLSDGRVIIAASYKSKAWSLIKDPLPISESTAPKVVVALQQDLLNAEPTEEEATAFIAALDEAEAAATRALNQYELNLTNLRYARIELETAHAIAAASNRNAEMLAGTAE